MIQKRNTYHTPESWTFDFRAPWQVNRLSSYYAAQSPEVAQDTSFHEEDLHLWELNQDAEPEVPLVDDTEQHDYRSNPTLFLTPAELAYHDYCGFSDPDGSLTTRMPGNPHSLPTDPASWESDPSNVRAGVYSEVEPVFYDPFGSRIAS